MSNTMHSVEQALKLLGIKRTKFYNLLNSGAIKAIKIGQRTLVPQASIDSFLSDVPAYKPVSKK